MSNGLSHFDDYLIIEAYIILPIVLLMECKEKPYYYKFQ